MVNRRIVPEIHAAALRESLDPALPDENFRAVRILDESCWIRNEC